MADFLKSVRSLLSGNITLGKEPAQDIAKKLLAEGFSKFSDYLDPAFFENLSHEKRSLLEFHFAKIFLSRITQLDHEGRLDEPTARRELGYSLASAVQTVSQLMKSTEFQDLP